VAQLDEAAAGVLNVTLYRRCVEVFGRVRITNPGEARIYRSIVYGGQPREEVIQQGEFYAVCCPLCSDSRFRCYINHAYGTPDAKGFPRTSLVHCFNDGCALSLAEPEAFQQMKKYLLGYHLYNLQPTIRPGRVVDPFARCGRLPGPCVPVRDLPEDHVASQYLRGRGFDRTELSQRFDVRWCPESEMRLACQRIIMPFYHKQKLVGWQARPAFDLPNWKTARIPKYYTAPGSPKRSILYSLDLARQFRCGVIVEGVTDVWRFGGPAVALLGATINPQQLELFSSVFANGAGVIMLDADILDEPKTEEHRRARDAALAAAGQLKSRLAGGCCIVSPPAGWDPGNMPRQDLRNYVVQQAAAVGVTIDWEAANGPQNFS